jgi:hypothetical protein
MLLSTNSLQARTSGAVVVSSSLVLNNVMRDYQPIWRIRSRISPL